MYSYDFSTTLSHHHHINHSEGNQDLLFSRQTVSKEQKNPPIMDKRSFCNVMKDQQNALRPCPNTAVTSHPFHITQKDKRAFSVKPQKMKAYTFLMSHSWREDSS